MFSTIKYRSSLIFSNIQNSFRLRPFWTFCHPPFSPLHAEVPCNVSLMPYFCYKDMLLWHKCDIITTTKPQNINFPNIHIFYYVLNNFNVITTKLIFLGHIPDLMLLHLDWYWNSSNIDQNFIFELVQCESHFWSFVDLAVNSEITVDIILVYSNIHLTVSTTKKKCILE